MFFQCIQNGVDINNCERFTCIWASRDKFVVLSCNNSNYPQERANSTSTPLSLLSHFIQRNDTKIRIKYHSIKEKRRKTPKWFKNPRFFQSFFSFSLSSNTKSSFKMGGLEPVFLLTKQFLFSYQQWHSNTQHTIRYTLNDEQTSWCPQK